MSSSGKVESARICFGGINPDFIHATETEKVLVGKNPFDDKTIQEAMSTLSSELKPDWELPDASPEYRKLLAAGLFYKNLLSFAPEGKVKQENKSGGKLLKREVSRGKQTFEVHEDKYPVTKPIPKIEGLVQCSGEAKYANDYPNLPNQLWAAFVHATKANAKVAQIDPSEALAIPGVVAFFSAKDIPGKNSFVSLKMLSFPEDEEIFAFDKIKYYNQPIGMIVAESTNLAEFAARKVQVMYESSDEPVLATLADVLDHNATHRIREEESVGVEAERKLDGSKKVSGTFDIGGQYHFTMEPQTTVCIPLEDGMEVHCSAQWMDLTQIAISDALKVPQNSVRMQVRRVGGGYGGKISRNGQAACAAALACKKLNRPIRFVQSIESMMGSLGKRFACRNNYSVEFKDNGKITKMYNNFFEDSGCTRNETRIPALTIHCFKNCYNVDNNWKIEGKRVITDAPSHTPCRAPGSLEGVAMIENIMEHIAKELDKDSVDVRLSNIPDDNKMKKLLPEYAQKVNYKERKEDIEKFNKENRWKKKGLGVAVMQFPIEYFGVFPVLVSIYHGDGTVSIGHGGIEMGQGLNTKVVQVAAYTLGIPIEMIKVEPSDSFVSANSIVSGGGVASEGVCFAVRKACENLLEQLKPIKETNKDASWMELITEAFKNNITLIASNSVKAGEIKVYDVFGVAFTEIEVDILAGNLIIQRVDILEDTGESLSPLIDIGQIEGAFIMGIGYWLTELLVYNRQNGELLTTRTWNYKPPGAKDIPVDFRIDLVQKSPNPAGVMRSKASGEPPICLAISVLFAIRHALDSARRDAGIKEKWFDLGAPTTPENIVLNSGSNDKMFTLS